MDTTRTLAASSELREQARRLKKVASETLVRGDGLGFSRELMKALAFERIADAIVADAHPRDPSLRFMIALTSDIVRTRPWAADRRRSS